MPTTCIYISTVLAWAAFVLATFGFDPASPDKFFATIGIWGPEQSGKSTLLNYLFGTLFETSAVEAGPQRTTQGINVAATDALQAADTVTMVLDIEGAGASARRERAFERRALLLALLTCDVVLLNFPDLTSLSTNWETGYASSVVWALAAASRLGDQRAHTPDIVIILRNTDYETSEEEKGRICQSACSFIRDQWRSQVAALEAHSSDIPGRLQAVCLPDITPGSVSAEDLANDLHGLKELLRRATVGRHPLAELQRFFDHLAVLWQSDIQNQPTTEFPTLRSALVITAIVRQIQDLKVLKGAAKDALKSAYTLASKAYADVMTLHSWVADGRDVAFDRQLDAVCTLVQLTSALVSIFKEEEARLAHALRQILGAPDAITEARSRSFINVLIAGATQDAHIDPQAIVKFAKDVHRVFLSTVNSMTPARVKGCPRALANLSHDHVHAHSALKREARRPSTADISSVRAKRWISQLAREGVHSFVPSVDLQSGIAALGDRFVDCWYCVLQHELVPISRSAAFEMEGLAKDTRAAFGLIAIKVAQQEYSASQLAPLKTRLGDARCRPGHRTDETFMSSLKRFLAQCTEIRAFVKEIEISDDAYSEHLCSNMPMGEGFPPSRDAFRDSPMRPLPSDTVALLQKHLYVAEASLRSTISLLTYEGMRRAVFALAYQAIEAIYSKNDAEVRSIPVDAPLNEQIAFFQDLLLGTFARVVQAVQALASDPMPELAEGVGKTFDAIAATLESGHHTVIKELATRSLQLMQGEAGPMEVDADFKLDEAQLPEPSKDRGHPWVAAPLSEELGLEDDSDLDTWVPGRELNDRITASRRTLYVRP